MRLKRSIFAVITASMIGGCSLGGMFGGSPPATFDLQAPSTGKIYGARSLQLTINPPVAIKTIDTEEVLVKSAGGRVSYFSGVAWADRLPKLFQARLVETFANSGAFRAILTNQDRIAGDLSLSIEIRDFQVEVRSGSSEAVIDVYVKLANERENAVVATRHFQERTTAGSEEIGAGVQALNMTFQKIAVAIVLWTTQRRGQS